MAKNIYIDGVNTTMNFNSGILAYRAAIELPGGTCCYCNSFLNMQPPSKPGDSVIGKCPNCKKLVEYITLYLSSELATHFNVRGPSGELGVGGIMHIYLPENHPEFEELINRIDPRFSKGLRKEASYGYGAPDPYANALMQETMRETIKKMTPSFYARLTGEDPEFGEMDESERETDQVASVEPHLEETSELEKQPRSRNNFITLLRRLFRK